MNINLIRRTLERIRVKALHNEFSGVARYVSFDGCMCAVGGITPPAVMRAIRYDGYNDDSVDVAFSVEVEHDGRMLSGFEIMDEVTGMSDDMLTDLQNTHDNGYTGHGPDKRQLANERVRAWAELHLRMIV